jgi:hypothetical protein
MSWTLLLAIAATLNLVLAVAHAQEDGRYAWVRFMLSLALFTMAAMA